MIVKSLEINNFGRHKQIRFTPVGSVIGVLGANGAGKSTVLDAVEFALTGETRDALPSYVRFGEGNASVGLTFIKNGHEGYIFRQVGKTNKRELRWNDQKITAAKDVDKLMSEIFGADKRAIANAVFVKQGEMERILFGGESDRKTVFIRMVNLAYCKQRADIVAGKIRQLSANLVDLTSVHQSAIDKEQAADENVRQKKKLLEGIANPHNDITAIEQILYAHTAAENLKIERSTAETEMIHAQDKLNLDLRGLGIESFSEFELAHAANLDDLNRRDQELRNLLSTAAQVTTLHQTNRNIHECVKAIGETNSKIKEINPNNLPVAQAEETIRTNEQALIGLRTLQSSRQQLAQATANLNAAEKTLASIRHNMDQMPADRRRERIDALQHEKTQAATVCEIISRQLQAREEILRCGVTNAGITTCPKCGVKVEDPNELKPETLETLRTLIREREAMIAGYTRQIEELRTIWKNLDKEYENAQALKVRAESDVHLRTKDVNQFLQFEQVDDNELGRINQSLREITSRQPSLDIHIDYLQKSLAKLMEQKKSHAHVANENPEELRARIAQKESQLQTLKTETQANAAIIQRIRQALDRIQFLGEAQLKADQKFHQAVKKLSELVQLRPNKEGGYDIELYKQELVELKARETSYHASRGALEEATQSLSLAKRELQDVRDRLQRDEVQRKLIGRLERVRGLLVDDGLPMAVVRHHFEFMLPQIQETLQKLDSDFTVEIDRSDSVGFTFTRLTEDNQSELPMHKLSGGQRIRLCLAFLIAVQKRLVREVGFLVLDEPTNHVDAEGVENMVELLRNLNAEMKSTEHQIWVVDHKPEMERAFSSTLKLSKHESGSL